MRTVTLAAAALLLAAAGIGLQAAPAPDAGAVSPLQVAVHRVDAHTLHLEYRTDAALWESFRAAGETPVLTRWVAAAPGADIGLDATNWRTSTGAEAGEAPVRVGESWTGGGVAFIPVTFDPAAGGDGSRTFATEASALLRLPPTPDLSTLPPGLRRVLRPLLLNDAPPRRDDPAEPLTTIYVYVTPDDDRVRETLDDLVSWRRRQGFDVRVLTAPGWVQPDERADYFRETIQALHHNPDPVEYVCLVGDTGGDFVVPGFINNTSDYPYGLLEGADPLPEAAVGRLSYNSLEELESIVAKILTQEQDPPVDGDSGYRRAFVAAGNRISGLSTILVSRWVRDLMLRTYFTAVDTFWFDMDGGVRRPLTDALGWGVSFLTYRGWTGMEEFTPQLARRLNNDHLPVAILLGCNTGDYDGVGYGYTEALLRAEGGAVGAIGSATAQSRVNYNNALLAGYFRGVLEDGVEDLGWSLVRAKLELFATYDVVQMERVSDHAYFTNLMGDPATPVRFSAPVEVQMDHPDEVVTDAGEFTVAVSDPEDNPLPGVRVGFYKEDDEYATAACTDGDGEARLRLEPGLLTNGQAALTVSGNGVIPATSAIDITTAARQLVYTQHTVLDDDFFPRHGNDNGISNPNETIQLFVSATNIGGEAVQPNITARLQSQSPYVDIQQEQQIYGNVVAPGAGMTVSFLVDIGSDFPDSEAVPFTITLSAGEDEWSSPFDLVGQAPRLEFAGTDLDEDPEPGDFIAFDVILANTGSPGFDLFNVMTELVSLSELVWVNQNFGAYDTIRVGGETGMGDAFIIQIDESFPWGTLIPLELRWQADDDYSGVVQLDIRTTPAPASEVTGPDAYGYFAIASGDRGSNLAPGFDWLELRPAAGGPGSDTRLLDQGEDDDCSVVLPLPFTFRYYGTDFNRLTVCSNGWAAFGDQGNYVDFRNLPIGSPQGPRAILCPWWDDLYQPGDEGGVYYYYDTPGHRFIVQWDRMRRWVGPNGPGARETFQLVLNDPYWHPTANGDGDILFIYDDITHEADVDAHGTPYATIGIGAPDGRNGLQYGFWNRWATGAEAVPSQSAIRFATTKRLRYCTVAGTLRASGGGGPVAEAEINVRPGGFGVSAGDGWFRVPTALADSNLTVIVTAPGFNRTVFNLGPFQVEGGDTSNYEMTHPEIAVSRDEFTDTISVNQPRNYPFTISNDGDGPLQFILDFAPPQDAEPGDPWSSLLTIDATAVSGDGRILGAAFTPWGFIVSGGNNGEQENRFHHFNRAGRLSGESDQPVRSPWGLHDLAWSGDDLYGGDGGWIYRMDHDGTLRDSLPSPTFPPRALAVDAASGDIYVANNGSPIYRLNGQGEVTGTYDHRLNIYGLAWHPADPDSCPLYIFSNDGDTYLAVSKLDTADGSTQPVAQLELRDGDRPGGCEFTRLWDTGRWTLVAVMQNPRGDRIEVLDAGTNLTWLTASPATALLPPDSTALCTLRVNTADLEMGEYAADVVIRHNAAGLESRIPVRITYTVAAPGYETPSPTVFNLAPPLPNPANGAVRVAFSLRRGGAVRLTLVDITGRTTLDAFRGALPAGCHRLTLNAADLPSGVYILRLEAAEGVRVRKLAVLK